MVFYHGGYMPMLVLTRKPNQSIMIGDDIEVTVLEVRGEQVRIGVNAPKHIPVHRREIYEEIQQQRAQAAVYTETDTSAEETPPHPAKSSRRKSQDAASDS